MGADLSDYTRDIVLPCKGFNLWHYMSCSNPTNWDFAKIREELDRIEAQVQAVKNGKETV